MDKILFAVLLAIVAASTIAGLAASGLGGWSVVVVLVWVALMSGFAAWSSRGSIY